MESVILLAIDPGFQESAWVVFDGKAILNHGKTPNKELLSKLPGSCAWCAIEMIASFGMPVGAEVFETVVWIGRFMEKFGADKVTRITRNVIKNHLCHSSRAKDANIRQAIIDRFGGPSAIGKKASPGALYGISADRWSALAVALTYSDQHPFEQFPGAI
jgi:hypothetical protein